MVLLEMAARAGVMEAFAARDIVQIGKGDLFSGEVRQHIGLAVVVVLLDKLQAEALGKGLAGKLFQGLAGILPEFFRKLRILCQAAVDLPVQFFQLFLCPAHGYHPFYR